MGHYSPTRPVDDHSTDNHQICEMKEELLCPFPGSSAYAIAGGHLVTFVHITHRGTQSSMTRCFAEFQDSSLKFPSADGA
jgi:hypothetical protein